MRIQSERTLPEHDGELLAQVRKGNQAAFKTLYYKYFTNLTAVANHIAEDTSAAEDVAQSVLVSLWDKRGEINVDTSLGGYLRQMAVREALAQKRKSAHRQELLDARPDILPVESFTDQTTEYNEVEQKVEQAIGELPPKCAEVFKLSRFEGMSYKEIADSLDISVKTVENQMGKALRQLRVSLREFISFFF